MTNLLHEIGQFQVQMHDLGQFPKRKAALNPNFASARFLLQL